MHPGKPGKPQGQGRRGPRNARERLRRERAREQAVARRLRSVKVGGLSLGVLAVAGLVGVLAANRGGDSAEGPAARPIVVGEAGAPATLTVYEDFRCPACGQFENAFRDTVHRLTEEGKLRAEYHLVTIIDGNMGGHGSLSAANAAACARDAGKFPGYHDVLYRNQPPETDDAFAEPSRLIELAGEVRGLDTPAFRDCVRSGRHENWVSRSNAGFLDSEYNATPTVLLNGDSVYGTSAEPLTPEGLAERVEEIAGDGS
nr:thioredoxin domain-containing protein [Streptomyces hoynatensis]